VNYACTIYSSSECECIIIEIIIVGTMYALYYNIVIVHTMYYNVYSNNTHYVLYIVIVHTMYYI